MQVKGKLGQHSVIQVLEKSKKKLKPKEIAKKLNIGVNAVNIALRKLRKSGDVEFTWIKSEMNKNIRLYYVK